MIEICERCGKENDYYYYYKDTLDDIFKRICIECKHKLEYGGKK